MSQVLIFGIGVGGLLASVILILWLAEPSGSSRSFSSGRRGLSVEVSDPEGNALSDDGVIDALEGALQAAIGASVRKE